jgi:alpha-1,3/alpha-1,6-mannosyltransferase
VLFYCHFPDQLLTRRRSALHAAYRTVLDACEESSTGQAHEILVNSAFTQGARPSQPPKIPLEQA